MRRIKTALKYTGVAAVYLAAWWALSAMTANSLLLPSPWATFRTLSAAFSTLDAYLQTGATLLRIIGGFLAGVVLGVLLAVLTAKNRFLYSLLTPLRTIIKATPIASFILILLVLTVSGWVPVYISALIVIPVVWSGMETAIRELDPKLLEVGRVFLPKRKRLRQIVFPQLMPHFVSSSATGFGLAWKSAVMAEVLSLPRYAIGKQLYQSKLYLQTEQMFAWTLAVILLSLALEIALKKLASRMMT